MGSYYSFGSYNFPLGFNLIDDERSADVGASKSARAHGAYALARFRDKKRISLRGRIVRGFNADNTDSGVEDRLNEIAHAVNEAPIQKLTISTTLFHRRVQGSQLIHSYQEKTHRRTVLVTAEFFALDPYQYDVTQQTFTWTGATPSPQVVSNSSAVTLGATATAPLIRVNITGLAFLSIRLTNTTTGQFFTLTGNPAQTSIYVDCLNSAVTYGDFKENNAAADPSAFMLFENVFPNMAVGSNSWTIDYLTGNAAVISSIVFAWNGRFH